MWPPKTHSPDVNAALSFTQPAIAIVAANDNAHGMLSARARAALRCPLGSPTAAPPAECRRWHVVDGERALSSVLVVEPGGVWRVSVTAWGLVDEERAELGWLLAHQLLGGLGTGPTTAETVGATTFVRRALSAEERERLRSE